MYPFRNYKYKRLIWEIVLVNAGFFNILISSLSNYSLSSFILKAFLTLVIFSLIAYDIKSSGRLFSQLIKSRPLRKLTYLLLLILLVTLVSLAYSANPGYGFEKFLSMCISTFPAVIAFFYYLYTISDLRLFAFKISVISLSLIMGGVILILQPFDFSTIYNFSITRASHVIVGRFLGLFLLIDVFFLLNEKSRKYQLLLGLLIIICAYSLYSVGMRAALAGFLITCGAVFIYYFFCFKQYKYNLLILAAALLISVVFMRLVPGSTELNQRYGVFSKSQIGQLTEDGSLNARLIAWQISLERIKENPVFGVGFGGFRTYYKSDLPLWMKYPHNILLEFSLELGLAGLSIFILIMFLIIKGTLKTSIQTLFFFIFVLFFAFTSKDIPSQSVLFLLLCFNFLE